MYDCHYNYIKTKYLNEADLTYIDTDSLMYDIKTEDFYADIANDEGWPTGNSLVSNHLLSGLILANYLLATLLEYL